MGCCASGPEEKYEKKGDGKVPPTPKGGGKTGEDRAATSSSAATAQKKSSTPDFGLSATHDVVKLLGKGGEGETWLLKVKATGERAA